MSAARSGLGWLVAKFVALGSSWLAAAYFARALTTPQATLGQFYFFETIVSLSVLMASSGTTGAITQRISSATNQRNRDRYLSAGIVIFLIRLVVVIVVMFAALPFYDRLFDQELLVGVLGVVLIVAQQIKLVGTAVLKGQSRVGRAGIVGLVDAGGQALAQSLLIFFGMGLGGLIGGAVVGTILASVFGIVVIYQSIGIESPRREDIESVMVYTRDSFISGIAMRFYDNIDILTIRYFLDDAAVGVYGIGFRFALPVQVVSGAIADAMLPEVSSEAAEDNDHQVTSLVTDAFVYAPIIALPATVGVAILAEPLVVTAFSGAFADSALIAVVAIGIQIPAGFRSVFSSALNAVDRPDVPARAGFTVIVANLLLDVILVPTIGPLGAVIASLAAIGIATIYLGYHVFSIFDLAITDLPLREFGIEIAAALFMGGAVYGLQEMLSLPNIPLLAITITTGAGVYFAAIMILSESIRQRLLGIADDVLPVDLSNNK